MDASVKMTTQLEQRGNELSDIFSALGKKHFSAQPAHRQARGQAIRDFSAEALDIINAHHPETASHVLRTARYTRAITQHFNARMSVNMLSPEHMQDLAIWHDIGKLCIPEEILDKPGELSEEERQMISSHSTLGAQLIESVCRQAAPAYHDGCKLAANIARSHHERWDGSGYPFGLMNTNIPLAARVVAVADVIEALVSCRSYKPSRRMSDALEYVESQSGKYFDPRAASAALSARHELSAISF